MLHVHILPSGLDVCLQLYITIVYPLWCELYHPNSMTLELLELENVPVLEF